MGKAKKNLNDFNLSKLLNDPRRFKHKRNNFHRNIYEANKKKEEERIEKEKKMILQEMENKNKLKLTKLMEEEKAKKREISLKTITKANLKESLQNINYYGKLTNSDKKTTLINIKGRQHILGKSLENDPNIVYCGRANNMGGWRLKSSVWANPFKVNENQSNKEVCIKYEQYLRHSDLLLNQLKNLVGKKLACWCLPKPCHTEVIYKIMKEKRLVN